MLYGADADGCTAAWMAIDAMSALGITVEAHSFLTYQYRFRTVPELSKAFSPHLIASFDIPLIQERLIVDLLASSATVLICDHHVPKNHLNISSAIHYLNPLLFQTNPRPILPSSLFSYCIAQRIADFGNMHSLLLSIGLSGDGALEDHSTLVDYVASEREPDDPREDAMSFRKSVRVATKSMNAWFHLNPEKEFIFPGALPNSSSFDECYSAVMSANNIQVASQQADQIVVSELEEARNELPAAVGQGAIIHFLKDGAFVSSTVARQLSSENPGRLTAVGYRFNGGTQFELRLSEAKSRNIVSWLNERGAQRLTESFGGHPTACGAIVSQNNVDEFIEMLRTWPA